MLHVMVLLQWHHAAGLYALSRRCVWRNLRKRLIIPPLSRVEWQRRSSLPWPFILQASQSGSTFLYLATARSRFREHLFFHNYRWCDGYSDAAWREMALSSAIEWINGIILIGCLPRFCNLISRCDDLK